MRRRFEVNNNSCKLYKSQTQWKGEPLEKVKKFLRAFTYFSIYTFVTVVFYSHHLPHVIPLYILHYCLNVGVCVCVCVCVVCVWCCVCVVVYCLYPYVKGWISPLETFESLLSKM